MLLLAVNYFSCLSFCLSSHPLCLLPESHSGGNPVHFQTARSTFPGAGGSCSPRRALPCLRPQERRQRGTGSSTNNWSLRGCLLNSNGIMLLGRWYHAHFLIKDSLETVYFSNKSLNEHNKTLHSVNFPASVYKLQVCPGENPARPFPAPKVRSDVGHRTGSLPTSRQRTPKA